MATEINVGAGTYKFAPRIGTPAEMIPIMNKARVCRAMAPRSLRFQFLAKVLIAHCFFQISLEEVHDRLPYQPRNSFLNYTSDYVEFVTPEPANFLRPSTAVPQHCGGVRRVKSGDFGVIKSPGYPRSYPAGLQCEWMVEGPPGSNIQATLFDARTHNDFTDDVSDSIYMSLTGNWTNSQRFSGNFNPMSPLILLSEANKFGVRLQSSRYSRGSNGFRLAYIATQPRTTPATAPAHDVHTAVVCPFANYGPAIFPCYGQSRTSADPESDAKLRALNRTNPNPFLVALILDEAQFCSGTLVSQRHVITSAGCTRNVKHFDMIFGTADLSIKDVGVQRRYAGPSDVIVHPDFDERTGMNDISVIRLKENVTYTRFVSPAEVPNWTSIGLMLNDYRAEMAGWGDVKKGTVYTQSKKLKAMIWPNTFCRGVQREVSGLTMCSGPNSSKKCRADSGSPVFARNSNCDGLCGTTSAKPGKPPKQPKPSKPGKPANAKPKPNRPAKPSSGKPQKPGLPGSSSGLEGGGMTNIVPYLLGVVSRGSCDRGFSITRITGYLDFLADVAKMP